MNRQRQLIGAGGILPAADIAPQDLLYLPGILSLYQLPKCLQIAIAAAFERKIIDPAILDPETDIAGTDSLGCIRITLHTITSEKTLCLYYNC